MDTKPPPFTPPAPVPRNTPPSRLEIIRTVMRNPLELWGEPSYTMRWIHTKFFNERTLIVNDPGLIRHVLVDNVRNYKLAVVRQLILRPILRDGLLTAEGPVWKRSRKAMAPVFTPRHAHGFARQMLAKAKEYAEKYAVGGVHDISSDMTELTYEILSQTLFSGDIVRATDDFSGDIDRLLSTMGRVDPLDLLKAPRWIPRLTRIGGRQVLDKFRGIVSETMTLRKEKMARDPGSVPEDFLTLLLQQEKPDGLTRAEIEDNIITFIGAGHETTARALGWTLYCLANSAADRLAVEQEIDAVLGRGKRSGEVARPHALHPRRVRRGDAALSAGAFDQPSGDRRRPLDRAGRQGGRDPEGHDGARDALDTASPRGAVGQPARLHPGAVPAGEPRQDRPFPVSAVRRGPARVHRSDLRAPGGGHRARRADGPLPLRHDGRHEALAGTEADDAAGRRTADARDGAPRRSPAIAAG